MKSTQLFFPEIAIGDQLPVGHFTIHSRFNRVVNFINSSNQIVFVTNVIENLAFNGVFIKNVDILQVESIAIENDSIIINSQPFARSGLEVYNSLFEYKNVESYKFENRILNLIETQPELFSEKSLAFLIIPEREKYFSSGFDLHFMLNSKKGAELIGNGDIIGGVKILKGTGYGLTPAGDDFIAGMLWGLHYLTECYGVDLSKLRNEIFDASKGKNELVNSFLLQAKLGRYFYSFKNFLSLSVHNLSGYESLKELLSIGATSGADMLSGYIFTIKHKVGL
jgi:hypothetical protein